MVQPLTPTESPEGAVPPIRITPLDTLSAGDLVSNLKSTSSALGAIFEKLEIQTREIATCGQPVITLELKK
ncbi:hypothetical protein H0H92_007705 [Tricholoma furcatifolium]|nr:hypothetical protein H0H92_007705 [Tricholoma furcatifolium]